MPNNDLISRNALLKRFEELKENPNNRMIDIVFLDGTMSVIDVAPAVDAEPVRHGKWRIVNIPKKWGGATLRCSECNTGTTNLWNYCPNCGAKMDKEKKT